MPPRLLHVVRDQAGDVAVVFRYENLQGIVVSTFSGLSKVVGRRTVCLFSLQGSRIGETNGEPRSVDGSPAAEGDRSVLGNFIEPSGDFSNSSARRGT